MEHKTFSIDVAKYFMDFLETNFHKRRAPKRSYRAKNEKNLAVGVNLKKFPKFKEEVLRVVSNSFEKLELSIRKGQHVKQISPIIMGTVLKYCDNISQEDLDELNKDINEASFLLVKNHSLQADEAKDQILDLIKNRFSSKFLNPLIERIGSSFKNKDSFEEDFVASIQNELMSVIGENIEDHISSFVIDNFSKREITSVKNINISEILTKKLACSEIKKYFEGLKITDLFFELSELLNNKEVIDKQELYIYLYDVQLDGNVYPLFYIPVQVHKEIDEITLKLDLSVYINKKAIDYIIQKINDRTGQKGKLLSVTERIIYINDSKDRIKDRMENITNDFINHVRISGYCNFNTSIDQVLKGEGVSISNGCYMSIFDKSDEALVNDYEELISLLKSKDELGNKFTELISSFLREEPVKITSEIEREWDNTETPEKLVNISPIPLNEEQSQISRALKKRDCKYILVEGPPGTGKSHSITAIVFNHILENKNVLVLSDKKEALDVVEDKITETLNSVRLIDEFQNPILRLGKFGNTYNKILAGASILNIKNHHRAIRKNKEQLDQLISKSERVLKEKISTEVSELKKIKLDELIETENLENDLAQKNLSLSNYEELLNEDYPLADELENLKDVASNLIFAFSKNGSWLVYNFHQITKNPTKIDSWRDFKKLLGVVQKIQTSGLNIDSLNKISPFPSNDLSKITSILAQYREIGRGFWGYLLKGKEIRALFEILHKNFNCPEISSLKIYYDIICNIESCVKLFIKEAHLIRLNTDLYKKDISLIFFDLKDYDIDKSLEIIDNVIDDLEYVDEFIESCPATAKLFGIKDISDIFSNKLVELEEATFDKFCRYLRLRKKIELTFKNIPAYDYVQQKKHLESLFTIQMTHILDSRVVSFSEKKSATAKTLKNIIKSKKKFPKEEFTYLSEAFPCIISGIRDYAEFIPLDKGLFDLVIIDEASQVSIAQALPALLRAKRVLVFGDKKQFSNIKSAHARSEINRQYLQSLKSDYIKGRECSQSELERLAKFDIKTSVLDFFEYIGNYSIMLRKHFRGYRELISYSSKFFYHDSLQAIKIRGKKIDDILEFVNIDHDGKLDEIEKSNTLEVDEIEERIMKLTKLNSPPSVGIITPHTNQQKLLTDRLMSHELTEEFVKKLKLKIMTFDTCQGEERDEIIYSMVANPCSDKLGYIFIKDLAGIDIDEDNKIKAQRLNVGFSRAKEKMTFILSKPIDDFSGSIGDALRHYQFIFKNSLKIPDSGDVDPKSPMEKKVLGWIQETDFFKKNLGSLELKAQFAIGDYLSQLDPEYSHPKYVCDFLLLHKGEAGNINQVIIEYDGFKEHFVNLEDVNEYNYKKYYSDKDIFREKTLEGYGYKFIRVNKFNMGKDPVKSLDTRLKALLIKKEKSSSFIKDIHNIIGHLEDGSMKECLKCGNLLKIACFEDSSLSTGIGYYCKTCKREKTTRRRKKANKINQIGNEKNSIKTQWCPKCRSEMKLRSGKYGMFWGCSKFPSCRGVKNYAAD